MSGKPLLIISFYFYFFRWNLFRLGISLLSWIDENDDVFLSDFRSVVQHSPINGDAIQRLCDQDDTILCLNRDNRNTTSVDGNGTKPCPYRDNQDGRPDIGNVL